MAMTFAEQLRQRQEAEAKERRLDWWVDHTDIPDLEFLTPECPICGLPTTAEDGGFICDPCHVHWKGNGYGHEATKWED